MTLSLQMILIVIITIYTFSLVVIFLYSLVQLHLLVRYQRLKTNPSTVEPSADFEPYVTVQLPIYNEFYVVERLIDATAQLNYPAKKLEIQVLDDSTDETVDLVAKKIREYQEQGVQISHIRRKLRTGFKAGALKYGLEKAKGDFVAVFDADFVPNPDFIRKSIPYFKDPEIGLVQTRWGHLNRNYSILTKTLAFALDAHFTIEQSGRNSGNSFINFNGTCGIWRKSCIFDAGNWQGDTLTEDLDLSYRAQLKGWKFKYLEDYFSPGELPPVMSAIKSQQYRWTKGGAENAKKHLWPILKANHSLVTKWHAAFHLMNSAVFIFIFLSAITSIPLMILLHQSDFSDIFFLYASAFLVSFFIYAAYYYASFKSAVSPKKKSFMAFLKIYPVFLSVSMGLSLHNTVAVLEGYLGRKTSFIRTPKFNILRKMDSWKENIYVSKTIHPLTLIEGLLSVYFASGLYLAIIYNNFSLSVFHLMLTFGFATVFYYSVFQNFAKTS